MSSSPHRAIAAGVALGITLVIMLSVTLTALWSFGWKTEKEVSETDLSVNAGLNFKHRAERQTQEVRAPQQTFAVPANVGVGTPGAAPLKKPSGEASAPYIGGNYVSGRSTIRYLIDDRQGHIEMYGYDVMRGRRVRVGSGRMFGKHLIVPKFYSFLDNTYGTLKMDLSEDGQMLVGNFEGLNAAQEGRVVLIRLP
jgi:hypothetical protein